MSSFHSLLLSCYTKCSFFPVRWPVTEIALELEVLTDFEQSTCYLHSFHRHCSGSTLHVGKFEGVNLEYCRYSKWFPIIPFNSLKLISIRIADSLKFFKGTICFFLENSSTNDLSLEINYEKDVVFGIKICLF